MSELPAAIAAQMAITQNNVALSVVKSSAEADRAIANILQDAITNVPTGSRGGNVNFSA
jgi:hypothetical protein